MSATDTPLNGDDPLADFNHRSITLEGVTKLVHVAGSGPAVIVMTEMPGISPHVARFSRWVRDAGFSVYMPSLFGRDGASATGRGGGGAVLQRACMSAEFRAFAANESSPVTSVAALAGAARARRVRRPWRRRHRHVLHGQLRAHDDARARHARAGALAAVAAPRRSRRPRDRARGRSAVRERLERDDLTVNGLPLRRRAGIAPRGAVCRLLAGARRALRRAGAARQRRQPRHGRRSSSAWW